ncbi:hypothetical protein DCAR_0626379 [Daucus carota subsp. sativus]|uniref:ACB domain-containing protein n=1 Tax=Daucus carota subsp. sativus TaxID=79200 RepID=A0AAF1B5I6_DAUCS|nr:hypothetical protein DCAR_0626379 [Daucus carota subsp. sativus]
MELFLLFQQLFLTALVTLCVSFLLTKFFLSDGDGGHVERGQKGDQESVRLSKVLKVGGAKSKRKKVRFVDDGGDQEVGKVGNFSGFEDHVVGKVGNFSGFEGSDEGSDHGVDKVGNFSGFGDHGVGKDGDFSGFEGFEGESSGGFEVKLRDDREVFDGVAERDVGSGEVGGVVEELGVDRRCEIEGEIGFSDFEKSVKVVGGERCDLVGMVTEDMGEGNGNEGNWEDRYSSEKKDGCEEVVVDECVGVAGDDGVDDQSRELEVRKKLVVGENSEGDLEVKDVVNVAFDEDICIEEADNEKKVESGHDDVLEDRSGEVRVLKDLDPVQSAVDGVTKQENAVKSVIDNVVTINKLENENTSVTLASGGVVMDQNEEVRVVEVSQGTGVVEMDIENSLRKGLVSDDDDDWEGIERSDLQKVFAAAANYVENAGKADKLLNLGNDEQMQLYALHKIALEGPCYEGQPMALKIAARAKWNAWQRLGNMSPEVAMEQYISLLSDKDPGWKEGQTSNHQLKFNNYGRSPTGLDK